MNNAQWCLEQGIKFKGLTGCSYTLSAEPQFVSIGYYGMDCKYHECYKGKKLGDTIYESILVWLDMEHIEPVLDDVERRYLSVVIKPFKNKIDYIIKNSCVSKDLEILSIVSTDDEWMDFFPFAKGSMYKGMETDREYTLEELGLKNDE